MEVVLEEGKESEEESEEVGAGTVVLFLHFGR